MTTYDAIILHIFMSKYTERLTEIPFSREELSSTAQLLGYRPPRNLGDVVYHYKYRNPLPQEIIDTAPENTYWRIKNTGRGSYSFVLSNGSEFVDPDPRLVKTKIPDGTPTIVRKYSISDEQALLAIVRYNRLIDIFLGITCYSLQNHLRTTVSGIGQIETDEIYVGVDKVGRQFIIPVQAKGGDDKIGITQIEQDIALCAEKYPTLLCRSVACQFLTSEVVAMFEFGIVEDEIVKYNERHYHIINANEISPDDLNNYREMF